MSSSIDFNKINSLFSQFQETITCDENCQKSEKTEKLKQKLEEAKTSLLSAPSRIQNAQKQFITYTAGEEAYKEFQEKQLEEKANDTISKFKDNVRNIVKNIEEKLQTYQGIFLNFRNVMDLYRKYKRENAEMLKELKESTNDILTNERKTYYQDQQVDVLKYYYYYIILIVYIISVGCYGFFSLVYDSKTDWRMKVATFIGLILLPFFSTWLLGLFVYILYSVYELLPKNVYKQKFDEYTSYNKTRNI